MDNRAAVLYGPRDLRVEDRPVPVPGPHEVLVRVAAVGVCGSDVHYYEHGRIGDFVVEQPLVPGHEAMGTVEAFGAAAHRHAVGTRVAVEPGVPCGRCARCRTGRYNLCADVAFFATPPVDGAFAHYVTVHEDFAHALPDHVTDTAGALLEPLSVALWAVRRGDIRPGDRVLVTGAGPVGLLAVQAARIAGAARVVVTDVNPSRLATALRLGADEAFDAREGVPRSEPPADVLLECSGAPAAVEAGILGLRAAGTAVLVGMGPDSRMPIPTQVVQNREITLTGTFRYANTYPAAVALAAAGRVDLDALVTGTYALDDTARALTAARTDPAVVKPVVLPHG
ncbi:NAD(P)-dependent alcohol dehydrogenase [Streptantibioticus parmotrematis]|uniref:NAD(P)-dependent alcohol dehydrogenase n=1 Tax=Streptantibioticus parmotrematis TaxID=2873249 RepID=UPI003411556D